MSDRCYICGNDDVYLSKYGNEFYVCDKCINDLETTVGQFDIETYSD